MSKSSKNNLEPSSINDLQKDHKEHCSMFYDRPSLVTNQIQVCFQLLTIVYKTLDSGGQV